MSTAVTNIGELVTWEPDRPIRHDAALVVEDGRVAWVGDAADAPAADEAIDADGRAVVRVGDKEFVGRPVAKVAAQG